MGSMTRRQIRQESLMKRKQRVGRFVASILVFGLMGGAALGTASMAAASEAPVDESTAPVVQVEAPAVDETITEELESTDTGDETIVDDPQAGQQDAADQPQPAEPATQPAPVQAEPTQQSPPAETEQSADSTTSASVMKTAPQTQSVPVNYGTIGTLQANSSDTNKASYWKTRIPTAVECYKYEGRAMQDNAHAYLTNDGKTVVLKPYGSDWIGDHWAGLIVKASTWDAVTLNPSAGTHYAAYDNKEISHYIVCKGDYPEPKKDASASVLVTPATCTAPATLVYGDIVNATFSGTPNGTAGPGSYNVVATSIDAKLHLFGDGQPTKTFSGTLDGKLPSQSTDPYKPCYDKPAETVTGSLEFQTISCVEGSKNWAEGDGVPGGIFSFKDEEGTVVDLEIGEGYNGGIPEGLTFGEITVTLKDGDPNDKYIVTPWSGDWTTVDPESLDCREADANATVEIVAAESCEAATKLRLLVEHASLVGVLQTEPGTYTATFKADEGHKFLNGTDTLVVEYTIKDRIKPQSTNPDGPCYEEPPVLTPGDIVASCVGDVPWLSYAVSPEGIEAPGANPLTVTFVHPTDPSQNYVVTGLPLSGEVLWPGAWDGSDGEAKQWPGWVLNADGSYSETDGNYRWTREGVTVLFQVNPEYTTVVEYPAESSLCANPPADTPEPNPTPTPTSVIPTAASLPPTGTSIPWLVIGGASLLMALGGALKWGRRRNA